MSTQTDTVADRTDEQRAGYAQGDAFVDELGQFVARAYDFQFRAYSRDEFVRIQADLVFQQTLDERDDFVRSKVLLRFADGISRFDAVKVSRGTYLSCADSPSRKAVRASARRD